MCAMVATVPHPPFGRDPGMVFNTLKRKELDMEGKDGARRIVPRLYEAFGGPISISLYINVRDVVATYESEPSQTCPRMMQGRRRSHRSGRRASWENDSNLGRPRRSGLRSLCSAGFKSRRSRLCLRRKWSGEESDECELTAALACRS